ncbi:MAG: peptidylprolyl isomerase [Anaerolineales bacterium]|nr:peptidylprolyl isomerase [Anaerolineales bacterium]
MPKAKAPGALQWDEPPVMLIDTSRQYVATLKLDKGDIVMQLLAQAAPITVNNFVFLARQGYYDGVTFHRVLSGFVAQAGDPTGTGGGGPGYFIPNETSAGLKFDKAGVVAMANSGADRNGSQFFISYGPQPGLDGGYTIFGQVVAGMEVVEKLTLRDPNANPLEKGDVINSVVIDEQ